MIDAELLSKDHKFLEVYQDKYVLKQTNSIEQILMYLKIKNLINFISIRGNVNITKISSRDEEGAVIKSVGVKAVYGIFTLKGSKYLAIVTKANFICQIYNKKIFQIEKVDFFALNLFENNPSNFPNEDKTYINMLNSLFQTKNFYFSNNYDLTNSLQKFAANKFDMSKYNERFCFNDNFLKEFCAIGAEEWMTPIISGLVVTNYVNLSPNNTNCEFTLISRRDKNRTGMRYVSRGADLDGNVSNFAETEQILIINKDPEFVIYSYVQTRGSIPFLWQQKPDMKWEPKGNSLGEKSDNLDVLKKHFDVQLKDYGSPQVIVNLIDRKGFQNYLGEYFETLVRDCKDERLKYVWFDFHHECRNMKYENLSKLTNRIKEDLDKIGWFQFSYNKEKITFEKSQNGAIRTNCIDCLDRTNVVQSVFGRNILHKIFLSAKISKTPQATAFEKFSDDLETTFRDSWTRNADVLSTLYTGTGALKTDFTKTGKRTKIGALKDGKNAIMRYVLNHFYDGYKQNCVDLLTGKLNPLQNSYKPKKINPIFSLLILVLTIPFIAKIILIGFTPVGNMTGNNQSFVSLLVMIVTGFLVFTFSQKNNRKFIEKPLLKQ